MKEEKHESDANSETGEFPQGPNTGIAGYADSSGITIVFYPWICFTIIVPRINPGLDATGNGEKRQGARRDSRRRTRLDAAAEKETAAR